MMNKEKSKALIEVIENLGWNVEEEDVNFWYISQYSPAGEDFGFSIMVTDFDTAVKEIENMYEGFDIEEHVFMWLEAKKNGVSGVPDVSTLVKDAEEIDKRLEMLWRKTFILKQDFDKA